LIEGGGEGAARSEGQEGDPHLLRDLIARRLHGLVRGHEDLNDPNRLRNDPLMQTAVGKATELGSSPTLSRRETRATREDVVALGQVWVESSSRHRKRLRKN
jgi:hypothetical protein